jgi:hypothetical protein
MTQLMAALDSKEFAVREKAMQALEQLDRLAEPALRQALKNPSSLETRRRLNRLLEKLQRPITAPDRLRDLRAVEVLEQISLPEARQLLEHLASGTSGAWLTQEARAALERRRGH